MELDEDGILIREEWLDNISWQNRAYLRKLEGLSSKEVNIKGLRDYLTRVISPQLAIAGHLDDKRGIQSLCCQFLALMRFLPKKEIDHKVILMEAAFGFDLEITEGFRRNAAAFYKYQRRLDLAKRWLWFLPRKSSFRKPMKDCDIMN